MNPPPQFSSERKAAAWSLTLAVFLLAGCTSPIGADRVGTRAAYDQVDASALRTGRPGADTASWLHRYSLDKLAAQHPDEAVRRLHEKAVATGERDLLFALAELSYAAGEHVRQSIQIHEPRDARDYYLGSAVYAYLFLFGEGSGPKPTAFDRRFRAACDFYNYALGLALAEPKATNAAIRLEGGRRRLPVGEINLSLPESPLAAMVLESERIVLADGFRVRGLSVRNRSAGLGAPLICVKPMVPEFKLRRSQPVTLFLRAPGSLADLTTGQGDGVLELYAADQPSVTVGGTQVPLENDLTSYLAYNLNQSSIWALGPLQFLAPTERIRSQLLLNQPYDPSRIPIVFVHGTFSSPVTWAEMANTLIADPVLRQRYQLWSFIYGSGNPLIQSVADLRAALTAQVQQLDPTGTNVMLRQMVVVGHSQGGLLVKGTSVDSGDRIWNVLSTNRFEDLKLTGQRRADAERMTFLKPLPFVRRVVFIATPHRGSYLSGSFVRRLAARFVSLPRAMVARGSEVMQLTKGSEAGKFLNGRMPTSLDGMSPVNPGLLALAELSVQPPIKAHSIIAIDGEGDYHTGKDGLVKYSSAHVDYAASELIVRSYHTCLDDPATIEEVRRILHEHLDQLPATAPERIPALRHE